MRGQGAALLPCLALAALYGAASAPAAAQTTVRSGEHATYSRLVVPVPEDSAWQVDRAGRRVTVAFPEGSGPFTVADVFARIPRTRLADLTARGDTLTLALDCDCPVTTFLHAGRFAVIDIADPPAMAARPLPPPGGPRRAADRWATPAAPLAALPDASAPPGGTAAAGPRVPAGAAAPRLAEVLGAELSRATAAGLLQATEPAPVGRNGSPPPGGGPARSAGGGFPLPITVRTAHDEEAAPLRDAADCPPPGALAVGEWGNEADFALALGALRSGVVDARDRLDPAAVRRLARFYIHHGFGAEAAAWLELADAPPGLDRALAAFFDDDPAPLAEALAARAGCGGAVPLWRVAAGDLDALEEEAGRNAVLAGFTAAPASLRRLLAPALQRALGDSAHSDIAAEIAASVARARAARPAAAPTPDAPPSRPEIAETLTRQLAQPGAAGEGSFDAAEALWREIAPGPEADALIVALIAAAARDGDLSRALRLQTQLAGRAPRQGPPAAIAMVTALADAGRASGLALAEAAGLGLGRGATADAARLAAARVLAEAGDDASALAFLRDIPQPRTAEAEALISTLLFGAGAATGAAGTGGNGAAPEHASPGPDTPQARLADAWRSGAWATVAAMDDGARGRAAAALTRPPVPPAVDDYAGLEALVTDSARTRALVENLLSDIPAPPAD